MKKSYFIASSSLKVRYGKSKGMQEKVPIMGIWCRQKYSSLGTTVQHNGACLVMPISYPRDRFFYPHYIPGKDTYNLVCGIATIILLQLKHHSEYLLFYFSHVTHVICHIYKVTFLLAMFYSSLPPRRNVD